MNPSQAAANPSGVDGKEESTVGAFYFAESNLLSTSGRRHHELTLCCALCFHPGLETGFSVFFHVDVRIGWAGSVCLAVIHSLPFKSLLSFEGINT